MTIQTNIRQNPQFSSIFEKIDQIDRILYYNSYQALAFSPPNSGTFAPPSSEPVNDEEGTK